MNAPEKIYAWPSSTKPQGVSLAGGKVDDQIEYTRSDLIAARAVDTRTVTVEQLERAMSVAREAGEIGLWRDLNTIVGRGRILKNAITKPLVWELSNAQTIVGTYNIGRTGGEWWVRLRDCEIAEGHAETFEAAEVVAQVAAQADYEARILSALHPASPLGAVEMRDKAIELMKPEILKAAGEEYVLEHVMETDWHRQGRHSAVRGMMVRLGLYAELEAAIDAALAPFARKGE